MGIVSITEKGFFGEIYSNNHMENGSGGSSAEAKTGTRKAGKEKAS